MNKFYRVGVVVCFTFLLSVILIPLANADWSTFHGDPSHSGVGTGEAVLTPSVLWNKTFTSVTEWSSAAVSGGVVYVSAQVIGYGTSSYLPPTYNYGAIYALDAKDGAELWNYTDSAVSLICPAINNGVVYVEAANSGLTALNASDGTKLWNYPHADVEGSSPTVVDGIVFVGSLDNCVYALNATTGYMIWTFTTTGGVDSSPAVVDGRVYFGCFDHNVYAVNEMDGEEIWNFTTFDGIGSSPSVVGGVLYIGGGASDHKLYALNATDGGLIWNFTTGGGVSTTPAVANGVVYFGSQDSDLYAVNTTSGDKIWSEHPGRTGVDSSAAVVDGVVYIFSDDGILSALNCSNGQEIWSSTIDSEGLGNALPQSVAVSNGVVYVGGAEDFLAFGTFQPNTTPNVSPSPSIPEFQTWIVLPALLIFAALVAVAVKRKRFQRIRC